MSFTSLGWSLGRSFGSFLSFFLASSFLASSFLTGCLGYLAGLTTLSGSAKFSTFSGWSCLLFLSLFLSYFSTYYYYCLPGFGYCYWTNGLGLSEGFYLTFDSLGDLGAKRCEKKKKKFEISKIPCTSGYWDFSTIVD